MREVTMANSRVPVIHITSTNNKPHASPLQTSGAALPSDPSSVSYRLHFHNINIKPKGYALEYVKAFGVNAIALLEQIERDLTDDDKKTILQNRIQVLKVMLTGVSEAQAIELQKKNEGQKEPLKALRKAPPKAPSKAPSKALPKVPPIVPPQAQHSEKRLNLERQFMKSKLVFRDNGADVPDEELFLIVQKNKTTRLIGNREVITAQRYNDTRRKADPINQAKLNTTEPMVQSNATTTPEFKATVAQVDQLPLNDHTFGFDQALSNPTSESLLYLSDGETTDTSDETPSSSHGTPRKIAKKGSPFSSLFNKMQNPKLIDDELEQLPFKDFADSANDDLPALPESILDEPFFGMNEPTQSQDAAESTNCSARLLPQLGVFSPTASPQFVPGVAHTPQKRRPVNSIIKR